MADKVDDQGFLQRWSARKIDARAGTDVDASQVDGSLDSSDVIGDQSDEGDEATAAAGPPPDLSRLPDVDTLDAESDYTGFLGENVPEDLAKMAMRKLWRSDPVLANIDGLNDYDEDFSMVGMVSEVVKTAYQVGKGYVTADDEVDADSDAETNDGDEAQIDDDVTAENTPAPDEESGEQVQDGEVSAPDIRAEADLMAESDAEEFHHAEFIKPT